MPWLDASAASRDSNGRTGCRPAYRRAGGDDARAAARTGSAMQIDPRRDRPDRWQIDVVIGVQVGPIGLRKPGAAAVGSIRST